MRNALFFLFLAVVQSVVAQPTNTSERPRKIFRDKVEPHWFAENSKFWYRLDLADGEREFVRFDSVHGKRQPALIHGELAASLVKKWGKKISSRQLPIDSLKFSDDATSVLLSVETYNWRIKFE